MKRAAMQQTAVQRIKNALDAQESADTVYQIVVEEACRLSGASNAALCFLTPDHEMLDYVAVAKDTENSIKGLRTRVNESHSAEVIQFGKPASFSAPFPPKFTTLFDPEAAVPSSEENSSAPKESSTRTTVIVPVNHREEVVGTLLVHYNEAPENEAEATSKKTLDMLALLADFADLARQSLTRDIKLRRQELELDILFDTSHSVNGNLNVTHVIDGLMDAISRRVNYAVCGVFQMNEEKTHLELVGSRGQEIPSDKSRFSANSPLYKVMTEHTEPLIYQDCEHLGKEWLLSDISHIQSLLLMPLMGQSDYVGLLYISNGKKNTFTSEEARLIHAIADQAGTAIRNALLYEAEQRQAREARALYTLSQRVSQTLDISTVSSYVAEEVVGLFSVQKFGLLLYDKETGRLIPQYARGFEDDRYINLHPMVGRGIAGWVFEWETPCASPNVSTDTRNSSAPIDEYGVASLLSVPMTANNEVIGVIQAMSTSRRLFTIAEMELLYTIANLAAVAIFNAQRYIEARARTHGVTRYFRRMVRALGNSISTGDMPQLIADIALELMLADRCTLYGVEGDMLTLRSHHGFRTSNTPNASLKVGQGLAGWIAKRGQTLIVPSLDDDSRSTASTWLQRDKMHSYAGIPLKIGRQTVGVIECYSQKPRDFSEDEIKILSLFADRSGIAKTLTSPTESLQPA